MYMSKRLGRIFLTIPSAFLMCSIYTKPLLVEPLYRGTFTGVFLAWFSYFFP